MLPLLAAVIVSTLPTAGQGDSKLPPERVKNLEWFKNAKWGIFTHYLYDVQCVGPRVANTGGPDDWDACIKGFDTEKYAAQVASTGASYAIFTMHQRTRYLIAPNATFDRLTGYKPGEACAKRDLVLDLYKSLSKRGVKLMLYWTGDGPRQDPKAAKAMGYSEPVSLDFVQKWADVAAEYGKRYKGKVLGWWCDGCYSHLGYDEPRWSILAKGLRAGNPRRILALNNPKMTSSNSSTPNDDYTTGEMNDFGDVPFSRWRDGVQWHALSFLGAQWCDAGLRYTPEQLAKYVSACNKVGGVVSIDLLLYRDGHIDEKQIECLKAMNGLMKGGSLTR